MKNKKKFRSRLTITLMILMTLCSFSSIISFAHDGCEQYLVYQKDLPGGLRALHISKEHKHSEYHGPVGYNKHINIKIWSKTTYDYLSNVHIWSEGKCFKTWDSKTGAQNEFCAPDLQSAVQAVATNVTQGLAEKLPEISFVALMAAIVAGLWYIISNFWWVPFLA